MGFILALDQGTTSSRAMVFSHDGAIVGSAHKEFRQIYPAPGLVEHDGNEIIASQLEVAAAAVAAAGLAMADIAAIGIANQRETTIVWDRRNGRPVHHAIVWQDRRTAGSCDRLRELGYEELFRSRTGLVLDPYFSGTKLAWILDHVPGCRTRAEAGELAFGTIDSWLVWHLTGGERHVTDATNASRTLLYDIDNGRWDTDLLDILRIPETMLPEVTDSSAVTGETASRHFGARIPVAGIAGDQQAALFGQLCFTPGMVKNTYGTGCFMLMHTGCRPVRSRGNLLGTVACRIGGVTEYAVEGSVFVAGAAVQWLRDGLGLISTSAGVESLAASVPDNGGVYLVPAFTGLGAPHWDPHARGSLFGLTRGTGAGHIARATLESIAFQTADLVSVMEEETGETLTELRVDGGAAGNDLLMQLQADLSGVPVSRPQVTETTAFGAACLAGLAAGYWRDRAELGTLRQSGTVFYPRMERTRAEEMRFFWNRALERSRGWCLP